MNKLKTLIQETVKQYLSEMNDSQRQYLHWKRRNVTLRGMKNKESSTENNGGARFGSGLYTAFLSNKAMAKQYGKVYFVVNAIPKKPKVVQDANLAEIFIQNVILNWNKRNGSDGYDSRTFFENTTIPEEMMNLGYDGLIIKGREMVNYNPPDNVMYFETEDDLKEYYWNNLLRNDYNF